MPIYTGKSADGSDAVELKAIKAKYTSKTKEGLCKNDDCENDRREKSAFCQECSNKHKK